MKYFSPSYWFKLWVLIFPTFDIINTINLSILEKRELNFINSNIKSVTYVTYNVNQIPNEILKYFFEIYLETQESDNDVIQEILLKNQKFKDKKVKKNSRNRLKRGINGGNEIEYIDSNSSQNKFVISFKPQFWEWIVHLRFRNNKDNFVSKFTYAINDKDYGFWIDPKLSGGVFTNDCGEKIAKIIYENFWIIANKFMNSSRRERIKIIVHGKNKCGTWGSQDDPEVSFISTSIRTEDINYYSNWYLDNLERLFPDWNSNITINLGLINDNDIRRAIFNKYPNYSEILLLNLNKNGCSDFCSCFSARLRVDFFLDTYSFGNLQPTFSYITKPKLKEISNIIASDSKVRQWIEHINDWNKNLYQQITMIQNKTFDDRFLWKSNQKEIIKHYIRDWSYVHNLIESKISLGELNKNIENIKDSFDVIKIQVNQLDQMVKTLATTSMVINIPDVVDVIPIIATIGKSIVTISTGAAIIAGI